MAGRVSPYRKFHRGLGVVVGIQLVLWIAGGLYFAWTDLDAIHGDDLRAPATPLDLTSTRVSPAAALATAGLPDSIQSCSLVDILGRPYYRLALGGDVRLVDARTGRPRGGVGREEAEAIAREAFLPRAAVNSLRLLDTQDVGGHHEYRGGPLPAWQVSFDHGSGARIYISVADGQVRALRRTSWRVFDVLWMLHTMDFRGRDDINNPVLRVGAPLALVTVLSGYALWWFTRKRRRRIPGPVDK